MSAFIMNLQSIAELADFIDCLNFVGWDYFGYSIPLELNQALNLITRSGNQRKIFNALYALNVKAVNGRYNEETSTAAEMPKDHKIVYLPKKYDCKNSIDIIEPWHYQLLKKLQCFIYQCTEDATIKDPLYKGLKDLEKEIVFYIAMNNVNYSRAMWG